MFDALVMRKILDLLTPRERRDAARLLGLMIVGMVFETLGVGLVVPAIALLTREDLAQSYPGLQAALGALGNPGGRALIVGGMLTLVAVYAVKAVFLAFLAWRQTRFAFEVQANLSQRLFTVYLRQPYTFHLQRNSAQLVNNVIGEVNQLTFNGIIPAMVLATELLVLAALCILLLATEPVGAFAVLALVGAVAWGFHRLTRLKAARWGLAYDFHEELRMQHLQQGLGGAKDVKVLGREAEFLEQFRRHNLQSARAGQLHTTLLQFPRLWLEVLAVMAFAVVVISMMWHGRTLEAVLPVLAMFAAAAIRLIPSVIRTLASMQSLRFCLPVIETLHRELQMPARPVAEEGRRVAPFETAIELRHVSYTYAGAPRPALQDVSLVIRRGESIGIVGSSGAGKSTLVDVVLGLLPPDSGEVVVDGRDIRDNVRGWQDQIGYVPQSIFLSDDTIRRNVAFGLSDEQIDGEAVRRAIGAAQLGEFVASLPDGLETVVGERGVRLSGGQRQRIGIARALYHEPGVLVLDEATSSLDVPTERGLIEAVAALRGIKTILVVAHRFSAVEHCNRLFRLGEGSGLTETTTNDRRDG